MLSKEDRKTHNEEFWGQFKKLMKKHMSSTGNRINWLKYPTDVKHFYLRLSTNGKNSLVHFDIQFRDKEIRHLIWEQLLELKALMDKNIRHKSIWEKDLMVDNGLEISRIYFELNPSNYYDKSEWKNIHVFFRNVLIDFDGFYQEYKDILKNLVE